MKTNALLTIMLALVAILPFHKAYSASSGCFEEHLRESISINRTMREFYIKKGFVGVQKVYRLLIGGEHFSLPTAKYYDQKALTYQKKGMDLLFQ